jgi:hypothetical protein
MAAGSSRPKDITEYLRRDQAAAIDAARERGRQRERDGLGNPGYY